MYSLLKLLNLLRVSKDDEKCSVHIEEQNELDFGYVHMVGG